MKESRMERRMLCADLAEVCWSDPAGAAHTAIANLEDISPQGVSLVLEAALDAGTEVRIRSTRGEFAGLVVYCRRESGFGPEGDFLIGIRFSGDSRWSPRKYRPRHILDPRSLVRPGSSASA